MKKTNGPIYPENWKKSGRRAVGRRDWKEPEVQENICPKCHRYGGRFKQDGGCQACGYEIKETAAAKKEPVKKPRQDEMIRVIEKFIVRAANAECAAKGKAGAEFYRKEGGLLTAARNVINDYFSLLASIDLVVRAKKR